MKNVSRGWIVILTLAILFPAVVTVDTRGDDAAAKDAAKPEAKKVKVGEITIVIPASWQKQPPANRLRLAQFAIPAIGDDKEAAELSVFNFGSGGTVEQQVERWKGQFLPEKRKFTQEQGKTELGEYVLVNLSGTYKKPVGPPVLRKTESMPGAAMTVAMIGTEQGTYFFKLVGYRATVEAAAADFRKSIGVPEKKPAEAKP